MRLGIFLQSILSSYFCLISGTLTETTACALWGIGCLIQAPPSHSSIQSSKCSSAMFESRQSVRVESAAGCARACSRWDGHYMHTYHSASEMTLISLFSWQCGPEDRQLTICQGSNLYHRTEGWEITSNIVCWSDQQGNDPGYGEGCLETDKYGELFSCCKYFFTIEILKCLVHDYIVEWIN